MKNIDEISITQIQEMYEKKEISIRELVEEYLKRIALYDQGGNQLNSILELNPDVIEIAKNLENNKNDYSNPLYGVPILIKDNINTADKMHTSSGSLALAGLYPPSDAKIIKRLREKGAIILGKTNMTEFANYMTKGMKASYSSRGGEVISPYNKEESPSGSSTGSAVAVTANLCAASIGTDTSGSIISPALANGIIGFRPSAGNLSKEGVFPISFTLDEVGPMTRSVKDSVILFSELTNIRIDLDEVNLMGSKIGIDENTFCNLTKEEEKKASKLIKLLEEKGANIEEIKIPTVSKDKLKDIGKYELKYSINKYFENIPKDFPVRSLKDIIDFNNKHKEKTLKYGQTIFLDVEENTRGDLKEFEYRKLLQDKEETKKSVIKILRGQDICILFQQNLILQYIGIPIITIPHGLYNNGMPYGVILTALNDSNLLKYANKIEQVIGRRVPPNFAN